MMLIKCDIPFPFLMVSIIHPEWDRPLPEIRPQPIVKAGPALAGKSSLHDPLAFKLLEPPADRPARHAEPGGQEPLRPPEGIAAGPHEPDQGVFGRLPREQIRQVRLLLASAYGQASSPRPNGPFLTGLTKPLTKVSKPTLVTADKDFSVQLGSK